MSRSALIALIYLMFLAALVWPPVSAASAATYRYPIDDITIDISAGKTLDRIAAVFKDAAYDFVYHNNGSVCSTPHITIRLAPLSLTRKSVLHLTTGRGDTQLTVTDRLSAEVSHCIFTTVSGDVTCETTIPLTGPVGDSFTAHPLCYIRFRGIPVMFFFIAVKVPYLLAVPPTYAFTLPNAHTSRGMTTDVSFARYTNGKWEAIPGAGAKTRSFSVAADAYGVNPIYNPPTSDDYTTTNAGHLVLRASVTHPRETGTTGDRLDAFKHFISTGGNFFNDPYTIASIAVRSSLIAPPDAPQRGHPSYGVLGAMFPLLVSGTYKTSAVSFPIDFHVVLSAATATIDTVGSTPQITAALQIEDLTVSNGTTGATLPAQLVPDVVLKGPYVTSDGSIRVDIDSLGLTIRSIAGSKSVDIPVGGPLGDALNRAIPSIAKVSLSTLVEQPQCVMAADDDRIDAAQPCVSYNNTTRGLMSRSTPSHAFTLAIDPKWTTIVGGKGGFVINFDEPHDE